MLDQTTPYWLKDHQKELKISKKKKKRKKDNRFYQPCNQAFYAFSRHKKKLGISDLLLYNSLNLLYETVGIFPQ